MDYTAIVQTPIPAVKLGIYIADQHLRRIDILSEDTPLINSTEPFVHLIISELNSYFKNPQLQFSIPYHLSGTPFQIRVWKTLACLPRKKTTTYSNLAKKLKTSPRAIGNACRANPLPILIPCHRVVAQEGLGGYKGKSIAIKKWLLDHERNATVDQRHIRHHTKLS